jgi:hypothetical protein
MRRSLPFALRHIVLLALAPVACGGAVSQIDGSGDGGSDSQSHGGDDTDAHAQPDSGFDAAATDAAHPHDSSTPYDSAFPYDGPTPVDSPVCTQYEDGGTGPCAPYWIQGDGCNGGEVVFPCGLPPAPSTLSCSEYCMGNPSLTYCEVTSDAGVPVGFPWTLDAGTGPVVVACYQNHTGRRPGTLVDEPDAAARSIGDVLARAAYLEAASVEAFLDLATQLEAHGAPRGLIGRLRRAAKEEVRHARDVGALARAYGVAPPAVRVAASGARSLLAIALENAREGCVRETWGAACAVVQSKRAGDRRIRETMRVIARDELSHAALSWDLARWVEARLTPEERELVLRERLDAEAALERELEETPPEAWRVALGLPTRDEARAILRGMHVEVWADAA